MNWEKIEVSLRPTFKSPNFESKDELKNIMLQFEFHYSKQREFT